VLCLHRKYEKIAKQPTETDARKETDREESTVPEDHDVFLSHNSQDKPAVRNIGEALKERGLTAWLDEWELRPGQRWQRDLEAAIDSSRGVAVFVGESGLGPWEEPEMEVFLNRAVRETGLPVIPVLLPGAPADVELPTFLSLYTWVDLRSGITEKGLDKLEWGITGKKPGDDAGPGKAPSPPSRSAHRSRKKFGFFRRGRPTGFAGFLVFSVLMVAVGIAIVPSLQRGSVSLPSEDPNELPDLYALRVQVFDPEGNVVPTSTVHVSHGNEPKRLPSGWWEVDLPAVKLPQDRKITVWVESEKWQGARKEITLGEDSSPSLEFHLSTPESWLRGLVLDSSGSPIQGATVTSQDVPAPGVETDASGRFELRLPLPSEARVRIRADQDGYEADETFCYAGRDRCSIELERQ